VKAIQRPSGEKRGHHVAAFVGTQPGGGPSGARNGPEIVVRHENDGACVEGGKAHQGPAGGFGGLGGEGHRGDCQAEQDAVDAPRLITPLTIHMIPSL